MLGEGKRLLFVVIGSIIKFDSGVIAGHGERRLGVVLRV
jgi:hypothetical protein